MNPQPILCVSAVQLHFVFTQHSELGTNVAFAAPSSPVAAVQLHKWHSGSHDRASRGVQWQQPSFPPPSTPIAAVLAELPARHCSG